jgi:hypothetical protein
MILGVVLPHVILLLIASATMLLTPMDR